MEAPYASMSTIYDGYKKYLYTPLFFNELFLDQLVYFLSIVPNFIIVRKYH